MDASLSVPKECDREWKAAIAALAARMESFVPNPPPPKPTPVEIVLRENVKASMRTADASERLATAVEHIGPAGERLATAVEHIRPASRVKAELVPSHYPLLTRLWYWLVGRRAKSGDDSWETPGDRESHRTAESEVKIIDESSGSGTDSRETELVQEPHDQAERGEESKDETAARSGRTTHPPLPKLPKTLTDFFAKLAVNRSQLNPFEEQLLFLCIAADVAPEIAPLCAQIPASRGQFAPTLALALEVLRDASCEGHRDALSPERPLSFWHLITIQGFGTKPLTDCALRPDPRIVNATFAIEHVDERLAPYLEPMTVDRRGQLSKSQEDVVERIFNAWNLPAPKAERSLRELSPDSEQSESSDSDSWQPLFSLPPAAEDTGQVESVVSNSLSFHAVIQLLGPHRESKKLVVTRLAGELHSRDPRHTKISMPHQLSAHLLGTPGAEPELLGRLWRREQLLQPDTLLLYVDAHRCDLGSEAQLDSLHRFIAPMEGYVVVGTRDALSEFEVGSSTFEVSLPTAKEQKTAWEAALGSAAPTCPERLATQFSFNLPELRHLARRARATGKSDTVAKRVWSYSREARRPLLDALAQRVDAKARWRDLVVPSEQRTLLCQMARQVRQRGQVYLDWGFEARLNRGFGITALFTGPSGTGKTMAAEVLANQLELDLYRIDLSAVINKYIGETEKNLSRIFDAAEASGIILFFDECEGLFSQRKPVKDSHDRYANIEINYLLQRLESYRGLAILATNASDDMDEAFTRRLRFVVEFAAPEFPERQLIWRKAFPRETPVHLAPENYDHAAAFPLTGGQIHGAALHAAFLAAHEANVRRSCRPVGVTIQHVLTGIRMEMGKAGRPIDEAEFAVIPFASRSAAA